MTFLRTFRTMVQSLRLWVTLDPSDNSCTLSEGLFSHMRRRNRESVVFAFYIPETRCFGFTLNPKLEKETQLCQIQYNGQFKCIGFETLCPSVGYILYSYGMPHDRTVRLSVSVWRVRSGGKRIVYYQIDRPHAKHTGVIEKA